MQIYCLLGSLTLKVTTRVRFRSRPEGEKGPRGHCASTAEGKDARKDARLRSVAQVMLGPASETVGVVAVITRARASGQRPRAGGQRPRKGRRARAGGGRPQQGSRQARAALRSIATPFTACERRADRASRQTRQRRAVELSQAKLRAGFDQEKRARSREHPSRHPDALGSGARRRAKGCRGRNTASAGYAEAPFPCDATQGHPRIGMHRGDAHEGWATAGHTVFRTGPHRIRKTDDISDVRNPRAP